MKILWIPHTGWHIPQRAKLFCKPLAERHEVHVTDWVADFSSVRDFISARYLRNFTYRCYKDGQITVHGIPRVSPALFLPALRRFNVALFSRYVAQLIQRYKIEVVVGSFVVPPPQAPRLVFDLFDDNVGYWRSIGMAPDYADEIERIEQNYLRCADAVVAVTSVLVDRNRAKGGKAAIHHIPNGVDLRRFDQADGTSIRKQLGVQGALVGVVGNQDKMAEIERLLEAAKMLAGENITFLLAGRGSAVPAAQRRVQAEGLNNVIIQGYVPPDDVYNLISALDVGLCPYLKTPATDACSPMKLILYSGAGIPTVCTNLEEVQRMAFSNVVLVEDTVQSLVAGIRKALQLPKKRPVEIEKYNLTYLVGEYEKVLKGA